jgi:hypothetical protein
MVVNVAVGLRVGVADTVLLATCPVAPRLN